MANIDLHLDIAVIYIAIFAFLGWIVECSYIYFKEKRLVNSGFLIGPFIPIYGFGAYFILILSNFLYKLHPLLALLICSLVATVIEYITSLLAEIIFKVKLWDYTDEFMNIKGRVCIKFSIFWFILSGITLYFLQPHILKYIKTIEKSQLNLLSLILVIYGIADTIVSSFRLIYSTEILLKLRKNIKLNLDNLPNGVIHNILNNNILVFFEYISKFKNLRRIFNNFYSKNVELLDFVHDKQLVNLINKETGENILDTRLDPYFLEVATPIIENPEYLKLKNYKHHDMSIYDHNINVAVMSYNIAKKFNLNKEAIIRGALLHDLFFYDWREEIVYPPHAFFHPGESLRNATRIFGHINKIETDIILKHMWPLNIIPPKYLESFIVCIADKIIATNEFSIEIKNIIKRKLQQDHINDNLE